MGKSTLFNRLAHQRLAIVAREPGTTRDRVATTVSWWGRRFLLVDTGGLDFGGEGLAERVRRQAEAAVTQADLVLMVVDGLEGLTPADEEVAQLLRHRAKPVVLAVNKAESERARQGTAEFFRLGLGEPLPISALHNQGISQLMRRVASMLPPALEEGEEARQMMGLAIVGRVNVGKSSLLNAIVGEERAIVSEVPGTTRDTLDTPVEFDGHRILLIDTAGIRRRGRVEVGVERFSVIRAMQAIQRCDVALLVVDATEPATAQDLHIAGYVTEAYKGLVIAVNKWDLARQMGLDQAEVLSLVRQRFHWCTYAPVRFTSALTGEGVREVLEAAVEVYQERLKRVPRGQLERVVTEAIARHPPPGKGKRHLRIFRAFQGGVNPPTFVFLVNDPDLVHFSYERYLENTLRSAFGFKGNHLRLVFKGEAQRQGRE